VAEKWREMQLKAHNA